MHRSARRAFIDSPATVVSPPVLLEIEHVITREQGRSAAYGVNDWLLKNAEGRRIVVPELTAEMLRRARSVQDRYRDLRLDLADAVNVVLAERYETPRMLTLDARDFRAVRPLSGHDAFVLVPKDES